MHEPSSRTIESHHNDRFKDLKRLHSAKGIRRQHRALVSGPTVVKETLGRYPDRCEALITAPGREPAFRDPPSHLIGYRLAPELFRELDSAGTGFPLLVVKVDPISRWDPAEGLPEGVSLFVPFQDPENVGAVVRTAVAFGVDRIVLLAESAHPFLPRALRASSGTALAARFLHGPALDELPGDLSVIPLSGEGSDITAASFPDTFAFLPGIEGGGLPAAWRERAVAIPVASEVESLNAAASVAVALYVWSRSRS